MVQLARPVQAEPWMAGTSPAKTGIEKQTVISLAQEAF